MVENRILKYWTNFNNDEYTISDFLTDTMYRLMYEMYNTCPKSGMKGIDVARARWNQFRRAWARPANNAIDSPKNMLIPLPAKVLHQQIY